MSDIDLTLHTNRSTLYLEEDVNKLYLYVHNWSNDYGTIYLDEQQAMQVRDTINKWLERRIEK